MRHRDPRLAAPVLAVPVVLVLAALLAACGTATPSAPPSSVPSAAPTSDASSAPGDTATVRAYFGLGSTAGDPVLAPVERRISPAPPDGARRAALDALFAGPTAAELAGTPALFTAIPEGTQVRSLVLDDGVATVDLSPGFAEPDELPTLRTALAQIVVTLSQFPEVTGVLVTIRGAALNQTDAGGRDLARPATRADYADQLGPLFVDSPAWGATLRSPFRLGGLADVFEAQFHFRLLDAGGRSLADGELTASCGTGCLGAFGADVPFNVPAETAGRLQVFDLSEADGSMSDLVDYPVTLLP